MNDPTIVPIGALHKEWDDMPQWMRNEYSFFQSLTQAKPVNGCIKERLVMPADEITVKSRYVFDGVTYVTLAMVTYGKGIMPNIAFGFERSVFTGHTLRYLTGYEPRAIHVIGCPESMLNEVERKLKYHQVMSLKILRLISTDDSFRRFANDQLVIRSISINDTRRLMLHPTGDGTYSINRRIFFHGSIWQFCQVGDVNAVSLSCENDTMVLRRIGKRPGRPSQTDIIFTLSIDDGLEWIRKNVVGIRLAQLIEICQWLTALSNKPE